MNFMHYIKTYKGFIFLMVSMVVLMIPILAILFVLVHDEDMGISVPEEWHVYDEQSYYFGYPQKFKVSEKSLLSVRNDQKNISLSFLPLEVNSTNCNNLKDSMNILNDELPSPESPFELVKEDEPITNSPNNSIVSKTEEILIHDKEVCRYELDLKGDYNTVGYLFLVKQGDQPRAVLAIFSYTDNADKADVSDMEQVIRTVIIDANIAIPDLVFPTPS